MSQKGSMPFDSKGRRIVIKEDGFGINKWLCLFIIGLPITCMYLGYSIGMSFTSGHNVLPDRKVIVDATRLNYSYYNTHNLSVGFMGNLGNEMFQYAALYGLAKANGFKPVVPSNLNILKMFPHLKTNIISTSAKRADKFRELKAMAFDTRAFSLNFMKNIELLGFFQSWRYFDHVQADVRLQFTFPEDAIQQAQTVLHESISGAYKDFKFQKDLETTFVGIHVRRGDLLSDENIERGYVTVGETYINVAMDYFINKYKQVVFIVSSDDVEWSQKHVKMKGNNPVIFSPFEHKYPAIDLCLLSQCNHTIMTVGTFGWWAAWLAGGETIYYKKFPKPFSPISEQFKQIDYFLPQWYGI